MVKNAYNRLKKLIMPRYNRLTEKNAVVYETA